MDKELILAVAGAGKTTYLINQLNQEEGFLIVTYTQNNYEDIKNAVIKKFKCIPPKIKIYTYFNFLYNFCFKPFEKNLNSKGIQYTEIKEKRANSGQIEYYMNRYTKKMYSSRLSKICDKQIMNKIKERIEKYFDYLFIDEIQDFASNDFNFIKNFINFNINILYVGDFYQHTFDTSRDGNTNASLFDNYDNYISKIKSGNKELEIDNKSLIKSRRCTKTVCDYVREKLEIDIYSYEDTLSEVKEITKEENINQIMENNDIVKLFYQNSRKYSGNTENWGNSKGKTYNNVCVVLNPNTYKLLKQDKLKELPASTKNKLYVACTRTENNLFFIQEKELIKYKNVY